jgi:hypothetical protein
MPARKLPFSTTFSTVYGTILGLVSAFYLILSREMASTHLTETDKVWIFFVVVYAAVLPLSGLLYAAKGWPTVGIIHAVLMIGVAGPPFFGDYRFFLTMLLMTTIAQLLASSFSQHWPSIWQECWRWFAVSRSFGICFLQRDR